MFILNTLIFWVDFLEDFIYTDKTAQTLWLKNKKKTSDLVHKICLFILR